MKQIYKSLPIAALAEKNPISYFDIGSRGGFQRDLYPLAFAVDAVGFEPDPVEYERLQLLHSDPWKSITFLPFGVSNQTGNQTLYIPADAQSASLLKHNSAIGEKFDKPQYFEIVRTENVRTVCLIDALKQTKFNFIDYLKIDIEGAELAVFKSSPEVMSDVLAVKTENSFMHFRNNQPLASEVDEYLGQIGFELMDIIGPTHWRRHGYLIHPYYSSEKPPYSRAQIAQADYLYFRDPDTVGEDIPKLLRLSLISMALGYFDHALMILERPQIAKYLKNNFQISPMDIAFTASKIYGRKSFFDAFYRQFRDLIPFIRCFKNLLR